MELVKKQFGASATHNPKLWVVTSGKGGVGKTFISSSIALTLSKLGHSVVLVDLDLGGANVHTALGLDPSHLSIRNFFEGQKTLQEIVIPTPYPHLSYIQGFWDSWDHTIASQEVISKLIPELKSLRADFVIVDMGAGALESHLQMMSQADEKFLISTPEPTSIEKSYRFIEALMCYKLKQDSQPESYQSFIKKLRDYRQRIVDRPFSIRKYIKADEGLRLDYFESLTTQPIRLILNCSRSQTHAELGYSMKSVCNKYYDLGLDYLGAVEYDNAVWQSVRNREPVLISQPFTPLAGQFLEICKLLIEPEELRAIS